MPHIRPIAIALILHEDAILVGESYDAVKDETFYRPLGGGIEFGEYGEAALRREFREEIGAELTNVRYLDTLENIFTHMGEAGHEIVLLYAAELADPQMYHPDYRARIVDASDDDGASVCWKPLTYFRAGEAPLYPDGLLEYIDHLDEAVTETSPAHPPDAA